MPYSPFPSPQQVAVQLASASEFGIVEVDGSTITAAGGVISAASQTGGFVSGPGSSTVGDFALWNNTSGTLVKDATPTQVTAALNLFTSSLQGLAPGSGGGTTNFLRADGSWAAPPDTNGYAYLGTVSVSGGTLTDTSLLGSGSYRSWELRIRNLIPGTAAAGLTFQVHSGGSFQTTTYLSEVFLFHNGGAASSGTSTTGIPLGTGTGVNNADPGASGILRASNLNSGSVKKIFVGEMGHVSSTPAMARSGMAGFWNGGNGAIDGFQIVPSSGTLSSGSVDIYGVL